MFEQLIHLILAALGLGLLIFVHEWGHYVAARKCKMNVEIFSIGFGKPIKSWVSDGVKWQIGSLPFGGYVKIRDLDSTDPTYGTLENRPLAKIIVSLAGPAANLLLCFALFSLIYGFGGRFKPFNEVTSTVSYVVPQGRFSNAGLLPGDRIEKINGEAYQDLSQFFLFQLAGSGEMKIERFNFDRQLFSPLSLHIPHHNAPVSSAPGGFRPEVYPAQFVIAEKSSETIGAGERVIWANGVPVFSGAILSMILNESKTFLSILRKGEVVTTRLPLMILSDLRLSSSEKAQITDLASEQNLNTQTLMMIPYLFNNRGEITSTLVYSDQDASEKVLKYDAKEPFCIPLEVGDQILYANGHPFESSSLVLAALQKKEATILTEKAVPTTSYRLQELEDAFWAPWQSAEYHSLLSQRSWDAQSLNSIKLYATLPLKEVATPDPKKTLLGLDIPRQDHMVLYNPAPWTLFKESLSQSGRTLYFLLTGGLSPSMLSGPIGIVKSMHSSFERSWREAIYWIGFISLSLAFFNLLPIPVLDGGMVLFFLYELFSGKRVEPKTLQKFIIPSVVILIGFMLYITYADILRLF